MKLHGPLTAVALGLIAASFSEGANAQLRDVKEKISGNAVNEGIQKNLPETIGAGRGTISTQNSSLYILNRDPFRAVRRGRQLFQRKFLTTQGFGGRDRAGNIQDDPSIGAGIVDSCAGCHGRPRGSAGFGGDVFTRPDSRDAPHLFGLGLQEMLGDEMTTALRDIRAEAIAAAQTSGTAQTRNLTAKGISFGTITANPNGTVNTAGVVGVDADLRVRPFFAQGGTISIREFLVGAFNAEMGIQSDDPDLRAAAINRQRVVTPSGMVLDGALDRIEAPPVTGSNGLDPDGDGIANELPVSLVDFEEFYLLHYFKAATHISPGRASEVASGRALFVGSIANGGAACATCHVADLTINRDRRIADVETNFSAFNLPDSTADDTDGNPLNELFAVASAFPVTFPFPGDQFPVKTFANNPAFTQTAGLAPRTFVVRNFFADLKRHDLGPNFHERNFNGTLQTLMMTEPLWGVGTTAQYGHDGRTHSLEQVILRHGGEAQASRDRFASMTQAQKNLIISFLDSLVLFAPDDTASNLRPIAPATANFPQNGHGAIALSPLFNNPADLE